MCRYEIWFKMFLNYLLFIIKIVLIWLVYLESYFFFFLLKVIFRLGVNFIDNDVVYKFKDCLMYLWEYILKVFSW